MECPDRDMIGGACSSGRKNNGYRRPGTMSPPRLLRSPDRVWAGALRCGARCPRRVGLGLWWGFGVANHVFAGDELKRLRGYPEINEEELIRFFTLRPADVGFIDPGLGRSPKDRLGLAVQLCTLPWLGFVPDDVASAPPAAVARLSEHFQIPIGELRFHGERKQTRIGHLREVTRHLNWKLAKALAEKELDEFLLAQAMEHDSQLGPCGYHPLRSAEAGRSQR